MAAQWIDYENKRIFYADYSNLAGEDLFPILYKLEETAKNADKKLLILANFTNSYANEKFMSEIERVGKETTEKKAAKIAVVGIEGVKKVLLKAYNFFSGAGSGATQKLFDTVDEAKKWLVE